MDATPPPLNRWALWGVLLAIAAGAGLRLVWEMDIEYKPDEEWMFKRTQRVGVDEPLPLHGLPTSANFLNPGLNVWIFVGLSKLCGVTDPPGLARIVQVLSILALLLLVVFTLRCVPPPQRELWLWAIALMALNPMAVIYHRKIWQPSLFPLFTVILLISWWHRQHRSGAFLWGLLGAFMGQVQMAGFFFAAGFFLWTALLDRKNVAWRWWLLGSFLGTLPLLPWVCYMLTRPAGEDLPYSDLSHLWTGKFWFHWITQPLGFTVHYVLGRDFMDFLRYPYLGETPTFLVGALYVVLGGLAIWVLARTIQFLWQERSRLGPLVLGRGGSTQMAVGAGMWSFGLLMTLSTMKVHRHYLLVAMPLLYLWLAWLILGRSLEERTAQRWAPGRVCLLLLCVVQGLISLNMLGYIHANQRYINGDFRVPYGAQQDASARRP